ncbi:hypothetical protein MK805_10735 [Shimazuella sp. AN120528]|uniref:hypothetical protein n=1 Tax=Shimazuella soli TaxID=1892854 RepID=UPI001F0EB805|nr:hypothetical protein [Shimazuella soli]MCH5585426.1 hypothetical protein [Shimazuella soli]
MEIYQNRNRRLQMLVINIFLFVLFIVITFFLFFIFLGSIAADFVQNSIINRQDFVLLAPIFLFGLSGLLSFYSVRKHWNFLKLKNPIMTVTDKGLEVYHSFHDKIMKSWDEIGEIEFRFYMRHYGRRRKSLLIKDMDDTPLANVPINMLDASIEEVLVEIEKYMKVNRT